jgi:hypothetical protein
MKTKKPKGARAAAQKRSHDRRMVLLDQQPIRQKAASECSRALARLEKAKTEWNRFQKNDQPAFQRWMTSLFDPLLIRVRGLEAAVSEKELLVHEVEMEMIFGGARSPRAAYREVRHRRDQPPPPEDAQHVPPPPPGQEESDPYDFANLPEFEQEELFEHFVHVVMGMNPDKLNDRTYARMFAEFKADVMGKDRSQQRAAPAPPPQQPPKPEQSRLKELYRLLVRRLHPDTQSESDTAASTLWHEVQEAYGHGNVERLEMLLALTDVQANTTGEHTSVSQMRSVLTELRRSFNQIQRNLRLAKDDPAWDFSRGSDHSALEKRIARELKAQLQRLEIRERQLDAEIAQWSTPPKSRKKPAKGR